MYIECIGTEFGTLQIRRYPECRDIRCRDNECRLYDINKARKFLLVLILTCNL